MSGGLKKRGGKNENGLKDSGGDIQCVQSSGETLPFSVPEYIYCVVVTGGGGQYRVGGLCVCTHAQSWRLQWKYVFPPGVRVSSSVLCKKVATATYHNRRTYINNK